MKVKLIFYLLVLLLPGYLLGQLKPLKALKPLKPLSTSIKPLKNPYQAQEAAVPVWRIEIEKIRDYNLQLRALRRFKSSLGLKLKYIEQKYLGPAPQDFIGLFLKGLATGVETSHSANPFQATNPYSSAHGFVQMTNDFWNHYSLKYFKRILPKTPDNQIRVARAAATEMYGRHQQPDRTAEQIARWMAKEWYGGIARLDWSWDRVPEPRFNKLTFRQFSNKVIRQMKIIAGKHNIGKYITKGEVR